MRNLILAVIFCPLFAHAAPFQETFTDLPASYRNQTIPVDRPLVLEYKFGPGAGDAITLTVINYPGMKSDIFFFHMHNDEVTAKQSAEEAVRKNGGTFITMAHKGAAKKEKREMILKLDSASYEFDPNRIFTDDALQNKTRPSPTPAHFARLKKMVSWVTKNILLALEGRARRLVVAVHNNTDDDALGEVLSILTEKKIIGLDNREVHQNPRWDIDNFYIATFKSTFNSMITAFQPNASLRMEKPRDIGYLSNWMITNKIDYINIETQHKDYRNNALMIEALQE